MYNAIIVEDDPMVSCYNQQYAESHKQIKITATFRRGEDALQYLREGNKVDLIILDIFLPSMDGDEFLTILRSEGFETSVIPVTAANSPDYFKKLSSFGIIDYLTKPFKPERFYEAMDKFIVYKKLTEKKGNLSQDDLDSLYSSLNENDSSKVGKGLQAKTLDTIMDVFLQNRGKPFTTETVSEKVQISKVTVRKYLSFLVKQNVLSENVDYLTGGRPARVYVLK